MALACAALVLLATVCTAFARADVVKLKSGKNVEGRIVAETGDSVIVETKFGRVTVARADVAAIDKGDTPIEALAKKRAALAKDDANGRVDLAIEAERLKKRPLRDELLDEALAIDPANARANEMKGRVRWKDRWVTPDEKIALEKQAVADEMKAKGLVESGGKWVTPEDKAKLDAGFVLKDGKWINEAEAKAAEGLVKVGDRWVPEADAWTDRMEVDIQKAMGEELRFTRTPRIAIYTNLTPEFAKQLADRLDRGFTNFAAEFETGDGLGWFGPHRIDVFVWRTRLDYEKFLDWAGTAQHLPAEWIARAKTVVSVHHFDQWQMAATYVGNRGDENASAHCSNMLGHVLLNRYRGEHRKLPPFLDESFAALTEFDLMGKNVVFTVATGKYARPIREADRSFFEAGNWVDALKEALRTSADTPLDQVVRREHGEFTMLDVAKGMALYQRWRLAGKGKLKKFFDVVRDRQPGANVSPTSPGAVLAIDQAFVAVEGKPVAAIDPLLRAEVMKRDH